MTRIGIEIFVVLLLFSANGLFAMMEMAVVSSRKSRLKQMAEAGDARAVIALGLADAPNRFLPTVQIGMTLVSAFGAAYGGQQIVRFGDWKGVRQNLFPKGKNKDAKPVMKIELYNLKNDIAESKDVSAEHPDIVAQIEQIMREQHTPSREFPLRALDQL